MAVDFSFGQIEAVCAALNRIADDKRVAFAGRLKQLQKQGLTEPAARPGRGKAGTYGFGDLMKFVVAVELIQAGIMPQMAARLVTGSWSGLQESIFSATFSSEELEEWQEMPFGPVSVDWYWMLTPEALREMTAEGLGRYDHMEAILPIPVEEVADRLTSDREIGVFGEGWRMIVLHGSKIARAALSIVEQYRYARREDLRAEIREDFDRRSRALEDNPVSGVEEAARQRFESTLDAARYRMGIEANRARYFPSAEVLERQATRLVSKLEQHLLAYLREEQFGGEETADYKAMERLMANGLIVPSMTSGDAGLELSPLGRAVQRLAMDIDIPSDAIEEWRRSEKRKINEAVQRKIDRLLASDPDNPEDDEALERWARYGGRPPLSEARSQEVARRFVSEMREELKGEPGEWEAFKAVLERRLEQSSDDDHGEGRRQDDGDCN